MRPNEKNEEKECGQTKNKPKQYAAERKKRIKRMWPNGKKETINSIYVYYFILLVRET